MEALIKHKCIKCSADYEDKDVDAYLCAKCIELKNRIAKEIDAKVREPKPKIKSSLEIYNDLTRQTGKPFINARDLGLF